MSATPREAVGVARQKLEHCTYLRRQRTDRVAGEEKEREERGVYDELAVAFGKKGIQAMIIEQAIPEIEDQANALLGRMTDNRMTVKFETHARYQGRRHDRDAGHQDFR